MSLLKGIKPMIDDFTEKKPICIIAQEAGGIPKGLKEGFEKSGCPVKLIIYNESLIDIKRSMVSRLWHRMSDPGYQRELKGAFNNCFEINMKDLIDGLYDALIVMRGNYLSKNNRLMIENYIKAPLVTWLYDPIDSCPIQREIAELADYVICAEERDLAHYGEKSLWLPLGYNDNLYKMRDCERDIDVLISGSINHCYRKRRKVLELIGNSKIADKKRCVFIGSTGYSWSDMNVKIGNIFWAAKRVTPEALAEYQSRAKICINIHRDDCDKMINPSFFSIPGSGSCQIAEEKGHFRKFLVPGVEYMEYIDEKDMINVIEELLGDERKRNEISRHGHDKVKKEFTLEAQACKLKKIIDELKG